MKWHSLARRIARVHTPLFFFVQQQLFRFLLTVQSGVSRRWHFPKLLLVTSSCAQGKTAEEIRKTFNIVNDFTPEEEAQVREENKWCEDA